MVLPVGHILDAPCPECGGSLRLKESRYGKFFGCDGWPQCDGTLGAHKATGEPLGTPADRDTKEWRKRAHAAFDHLWESGNMKRGQAYAWLSHRLGVSREDCHIGMFDARQCREVVRLSLEAILNGEIVSRPWEARKRRRRAGAKR